MRATDWLREKNYYQRYRIFICEKNYYQSVDNFTSILQMGLRWYIVLFFSLQIYMYTHMCTRIHILNIYILQKKEKKIEEGEQWTATIWQLEERLISLPKGAWHFGESSFLRLTKGAKIPVKDLRRPLGSTQTSHCNKAALWSRPFLTSTCLGAWLPPLCLATFRGPAPSPRGSWVSWVQKHLGKHPMAFHPVTTGKGPYLE